MNELWQYVDDQKGKLYSAKCMFSPMPLEDNDPL